MLLGALSNLDACARQNAWLVPLYCREVPAAAFVYILHSACPLMSAVASCEGTAKGPRTPWTRWAVLPCLYLYLLSLCLYTAVSMRLL